MDERITPISPRRDATAEDAGVYLARVIWEADIETSRTADAAMDLAVRAAERAAEASERSEAAYNRAVRAANLGVSS